MTRVSTIPPWPLPSVAGPAHAGAGSRRTHAARLARLRELGTDEATLARIHKPIGLDLGGDTPVEIALAILAEIIAERHHPMSHDAGAETQVAGPIGTTIAVGVSGEPGAPQR